MAALSMRFVFIISYLQVFIVIHGNGLTLPLHAITTKCDSFIKKANKETNTPKENVEIENLNQAADFTYLPFLTPDACGNIVSPVSICPAETNPLKNGQAVSNELPKGVLPPSQTCIDNADITFNLLHTPEDLFLNGKNAITISEPQTFTGSNICGNYLDIPITTNTITGNSKSTGSKVPIAITSTVTSSVPYDLALESLVLFDDNRIDVPDSPSITPLPDSVLSPRSTNPLTLSNLVTSPTPVFSNSLSPGLKLPLSVSSSIYNLDPLTLTPKSNVIEKSVPISLSSSEFSPCINLQPSIANQNVFESPQLFPYWVSNPESAVFLSPQCNNFPQEFDLRIPSSVPTSISSFESYKTANTSNSLCEDLSNKDFLVPLDTYSTTLPLDNENFILNLEVPNIKRDAAGNNFNSPLVNLNRFALDSTPINQASSFNSVKTNLVSPLLDCPGRFPKLPNSVIGPPFTPLSLAAIPTTYCNLENAPTQNSLYDSFIYSSFPTVTNSNLDIDPYILSPVFLDASKKATSTCKPFNNLPGLSSSPVCGTPLPLSSACFDNSINSNFGDTPLDTTNENFVNLLNNGPCYSNINIPSYQFAPNLPLIGSQFNSVTSPTQFNSNNYVVPLADNSQMVSPTLPELLIPISPAPVISTPGMYPLASFKVPPLPINPIGKYFKEARAVNSKLNDFISSFTKKLYGTNSVQPMPLETNSNTLLEANKAPISQQLISEPTPFLSVPAVVDTSFILDTPTPKDYSFNTPQVQQNYINTYNNPIASTPYQYNYVQDTLLNNNFLSNSFYSNPSNTYSTFPISVGSELPSVSFTGTNSYYSKPSTFGVLADNPFYDRQPITPTRSLDSYVSSNPVITNSIGSTSIAIPDLLSFVSPGCAKDTNSVCPKKPMPYLSSLSINETPVCAEIVPNYSINQQVQNCISSPPNILSLLSSPLDPSVGSLNCDDIKTLIALLELLMILNE